MRLKLYDGTNLTYEPPIGGEGWVTGYIGAQRNNKTIHVYCRKAEHGGGVFIDDGTGQIVKAVTGERTVRFNNRLWTYTEEAEHAQRIKEEDTL